MHWASTLDPSINEVVYDFRRKDFFLGINSNKFVVRLLSPDGRQLWFVSSETVKLFSGRDRETDSLSWDDVTVVDSRFFWADRDLFWDDVAVVDSNLFWDNLDLDFKVLWAVTALIVVLTIGCNKQGKKSASHCIHQILKSKSGGSYWLTRQFLMSLNEPSI